MRSNDGIAGGGFTRLLVASRLVLLACLACLALPFGAAASPDNPQADVTIRPVPAGRQAQRVAILPITGPIDDVTLWSLERRLKSVREQGFDAAVLELDTPGGEVGATIDICLRVKTEAPANTVAWIHPKAYSAGTFIALSCREIVVAPGSVFGDAAPIVALPGLGLQPLPAAERAKMESPLLDELDAAAERRGDDPRLLHAFVATERELWLVERASDGARRFADRADLERLGLDPASAPTKPDPGSAQRPSAPSDVDFATGSADGWRIVESVDSASRLLVAQSDEALRWGLAAGTARDDREIEAFFAARESTRFPESWTESLVRFLVSWPIRVLLIAIFVVALVIEALHPGVGIPGAIAGGALLLLSGAPGILGLAEWWEILTVLLGIVLIGVEIFVTPGIGFIGLFGAICVLFGLIASFTGSDPTSAGERSALLTASTTTVAGLTIGGLLTWFASRWFRETSVFRRAVLAAEIGGAHDVPIRGEPKLPRAGTAGIADSDLRPSGRVRIGDELFDAQSTGDYIARGAPVTVVGAMGSSLVVESAAAATPGRDTPRERKEAES
jgi:membrane-bound serine protease (ClpP class)